MKIEARTLDRRIPALKKLIDDTKEREVYLNMHLGHADDYKKGSLAVSLRWDVLEILVNNYINK